MSDLAKIAEALQAAGHEEAGRLVCTIADQQRKQQAQPSAPADSQTAAAADSADAFARQIEAAQQRSGGWTSVPIDAPISDQTGRF